MIEINKTHVGLRVLAISENAAIFQLADQGVHHRMISAHDRETVERHVLDEGAECLLHGVEGMEMVEMLWIDVRHNGDVSRQL